MRSLLNSIVASVLVLPFGAGGQTTHEPEALSRLLVRISGSKAKGEKPVVLFDIDDPLVNTAGRHLRILKEFAAMGTVVGGFENEPRNVNIFKTAFPEASMIYLDTKHSGKKDASGAVIAPAAGIPRVRDFRLP